MIRFNLTFIGQYVDFDGQINGDIEWVFNFLLIDFRVINLKIEFANDNVNWVFVFKSTVKRFVNFVCMFKIVWVYVMLW